VLPDDGDDDDDPDAAHRCCTTKVLYKRVPILRWLPEYKVAEHGVPDLVAGFTVGLTVIPQAIAFANVAGLPPQVSERRTLPDGNFSDLFF